MWRRRNRGRKEEEAADEEWSGVDVKLRGKRKGKLKAG